MPFAMLPGMNDTLAGHPFAQITLSKDSTQ
jgi:hypothetical protein